MNFIWQLAVNLALPIAVFTLIATLFSIAICIHAAIVRHEKEHGSPQYTDARWRQMAAIQIVIVLAVVAIIFNSIPAPDYKVRYVKGPTVVQTKEKIVFKDRVVYRDGGEYMRIFDTCADRYDRGNEQTYLDEHEFQACEKLAYFATGKKIKTITRSVNSKAKTDRYILAFDDCNSNSLEGTPDEIVGRVRNERLEICRKMAEQAVS